MLTLNTGQCGLCTHFGEDHPQEPQLVQIRTSHQAPANFVESCGRNSDIHLKVTATSGCDGFEPAEAA